MSHTHYHQSRFLNNCAARIARAATDAHTESMRQPCAGIAARLARIVSELADIAPEAHPDSLAKIEHAARAIADAAALQEGTR